MKLIFDNHTRRRFLRNSGCSLGAIALANLLAKDGRSAPAETPSVNPLAPKSPQFPPTAKNVIFLFMSGGPSQLDLFDPKPELQKWHGKPLPASLTKDLKLAFVKPSAAVMASPRQFRAFGQCGTEFSDYLPHIASCADDICLLRSVQTDAFNPDPGELLVMTASTHPVR